MNILTRLNTRITLRGMLSLAVVVCTVVPLVYVIVNALQLTPLDWLGLWTSRLPVLLWNTLSLAALVAIGCLTLGVSAAWWISRHDFIGRRVAIWLMILPLTIPTYVFAHIYTVLLEDNGWLGQLWQWLFGMESAPPELYNIFGVGFVLTLAGFSYVFLLVRDSLSRAQQNMEEAARIQGATPTQVFWHINLPLMRPAIAAGLALVVLHVVSDFGAVSMLRYPTFTLSIYLQMSGRFDFQAAAGLSMVLVSLSLTFLILERFFRRRQRYYGNAQSQRIELRPTTPFVQAMIWLWLGFIVLFAFVLPLAWLLVWSWHAWMQSLLGAEFWGYVGNSLLISAAAASVAVVAALPVALYHARQRSVLSHTYMQLSCVGFVLPGPVVALGILAFVVSVIPSLYGGLVVLVLAMVVRFLPLALQSQESAAQQLTPSVEEAGRSLGASPWQNLVRVVLPMLKGGMVTAWVLVFIDTMKELPATLLLRPIGFDTLPVRIWIEASEEMLELAAPAALMLMIGTLPVLWFFMRPNKY